MPVHHLALYGLSAREPEAHSRVELLPERLEMRRRMRHFGRGRGRFLKFFVFIRF